MRPLENLKNLANQRS